MFWVLIAAGVGGIVGGVASVGADVWNGRPVDWGRAGETAAISALATGVTVGTFGLGTAAVAAVTPVALTTTEAVVAGASVGYVACDAGERVSIATETALTGQSRPYSPLATNTLLCTATFGVANGLTNAVTPGLAVKGPQGPLTVTAAEDAAPITGAWRANSFGAGWKPLSLDETLARLGSVEDWKAVAGRVDKTGAVQKVEFVNEKTGWTVTYSPQGNYFRIVKVSGKNSTPVGSDLRQPPTTVTEVDASGQTVIRNMTKEELKGNQALTHFLNTGSLDEARALAQRLGFTGTIQADGTIVMPSDTSGFLTAVGKTTGN